MFTEIIAPENANLIMERYMRTLNKEYDCPNLPWCYFKVDVKTLDISNILKLNINLYKIVYCYDEQQKKLYQTKFNNILDIVNNLEPWDEIDLEIFDDILDWTVAITHEREVIFYGVENLNN